MSNISKLVAVIIPNFNGIQHLDICLSSLVKQTYTNIKVIVVDNNSSDNSVSFIKKNYPQYSVECLKENTGFAFAVNYGIKKAESSFHPEYILLLNNDIECNPDFIEKLVNQFSSANIKLGSVACKMLNYFERNKIDDTGNFISARKMPFPRGQGETDNGQYSKTEYIYSACAGAALYRSDVFKTIGFFDEDYFAYYEDVDLSFRMNLAGYSCIYTPSAVCYHKRGGTINSNYHKYIYLIERNIFIFRMKNYPAKILFLYFPFYTISYIKRLFKYIFSGSFKYFLYACKGKISAAVMIPKIIIKRRELKNNNIYNFSKINSIFT